MFLEIWTFEKYLLIFFTVPIYITWIWLATLDFQTNLKWLFLILWIILRCDGKPPRDPNIRKPPTVLTSCRRFFDQAERVTNLVGCFSFVLKTSERKFSKNLTLVTDWSQKSKSLPDFRIPFHLTFWTVKIEIKVLHVCTYVLVTPWYIFVLLYSGSN